MPSGSTFEEKVTRIIVMLQGEYWKSWTAAHPDRAGFDHANFEAGWMGSEKYEWKYGVDGNGYSCFHGNLFYFVRCLYVWVKTCKRLCYTYTESIFLKCYMRIQCWWKCQYSNISRYSAEILIRFSHRPKIKSTENQALVILAIL